MQLAPGWLNRSSVRSRATQLPAFLAVLLLFATDVRAEDVTSVATTQDNANVSTAKRSTTPKQMLVAESTRELRVELRLVPYSDESDPEALPALLVDSAEIVERKESRDDARTSGRAVEMHRDVRVRSRDGTVNARADRAVLLVESERGDKPMGDTLTIKLFGNVAWNSGGVEASSDEMTVVIQPRLRDTKPVPRASEMDYRGGARFSTASLSAKADHIKVEFGAVDILATESASHILLEGHAELSRSPQRGAAWSMMRAERMEYWPDRAPKSNGNPAEAKHRGIHWHWPGKQPPVTLIPTQFKLSAESIQLR